MARRFRVTFDLEFSYDIDLNDVAGEVSAMLDTAELDYTEVYALPLDPDSQADGSSLEDIL